MVIDAAAYRGDPVSWTASAQDELQANLLDHGAVLIRGFEGIEDRALESLTELVAGPPMAYREKQTSRSQISGNVFTATDTPARFRIQMHNESAFAATWPRHLAFCCRVPAAAGGRTPLADARRVYQRIDPAIRDRFERLGIMYVRNFGLGPGMSWQYAFQVADVAELRAYCATAQIDLEQVGQGRWRTRQLRPAVAVHPETGETVWFNHAVALHVSSLDSNLQATLRRDRGELEMPINTCYGDGAPIEDEVIEHLRQAYAAETVRFEWKAGDVLVLDNMLVCHGREPYEGPRAVVVVPSTPTSWSAVAHSGVATPRAATPAPVSRPRAVPAPAPRSTPSDMEAKLLALWRELLDDDDVSVEDDFFDAGGDSILAADAVAAIEARLGHVITLDDLYRAPSAGALAADLANTEDLCPRERLLALSESGDGTPLFVAGTGAGERAHNLCRHLRDGRPVYALFMKADDPELRTLPVIEALAKHYLAEVRAVRPSGPYAFLGFCGQGLVLYEMALTLIAEGETVEYLGLIETTAPGPRSLQYKLRHLLSRETKRVRYHATSLMSRTASERIDYLKAAKDTLIERARGGSTEASTTQSRPIHRDYTPSQYPGRLTLFAGDIARFHHDVTLGWTKHAEGGVDVQHCPGRHLDMLLPPHVAQLAAAVDSGLDPS